ncbi:uncharacterized protein [Diadema antillarum]|uniref:uncharacterized protein n=1 Tax=Diadema antillarum TaxID=105358 RepID=UPI003A8B0126
MTRKEKIKEIDKELEKTLELCLSAGLDRNEIKACAEPLLTIQAKWKRQEQFKFWLLVSIVVSVCAVMYQCQATSEFISAIAKLGMVKLVLPYWDWTGLHQQECIFYNPYEAGNEITAEDCEPLKGLEVISRIHSVDQDVMAEDFLYSAVPVIITDATQDWKAIKDQDFNFQFLKDLYLKDPILSNSSVCSFFRPESSLQSLLENASSLGNFQTYWGNCKLSSAKVFRRFYTRPYFLPGMVEAGSRNYVLIGRLEDPAKPVEYTHFDPYTDQMTWISQVRGSFKIKLIPHSVCQEECSVLEDTLEKGETLVYVNDLWQLQYTAGTSEEAVAISSGGLWNN